TTSRYGEVLPRLSAPCKLHPASRWQCPSADRADRRSRHVVAVDGGGEGNRATEQVEAADVQLVTVHGAGTVDVAHSLALAAPPLASGAAPVATLRRAVALDPDLRSNLGRTPPSGRRSSGVAETHVPSSCHPRPVMIDRYACPPRSTSRRTRETHMIPDSVTGQRNRPCPLSDGWRAGHGRGSYAFSHPRRRVGSRC